jgi:hypothetical protein
VKAKHEAILNECVMNHPGITVLYMLAETLIYCIIQVHDPVLLAEQEDALQITTCQLNITATATKMKTMGKFKE